MTDQTPHPATFSDAILETILTLILKEQPEPENFGILDPFAGVGRIHELQRHGFFTVGVELETEWAAQSDYTNEGSALHLCGAIPDWCIPFDAIVTSPCYGNRMADTYDGRDGSSRRTYRISLGRMPSSGSSAILQWGEAYRIFHRRAWAEATRVVDPGGLFILNIKDHWRKGRWQHVPKWHRRALEALGWEHETTVEVDSGRGYGFGANMDRKRPELVMQFRLKDWGF